MSVNEKMTAIADNIRAKTGGTEKLNLDQMASSVDEVYEAGKKAEYDAFWDEYQLNGARTVYSGCFSGPAWKKTNFKPKYDIRPSDAINMFWNCWVTEDLVELLSNLGVTLDFSNCKTVATAFAYCGLTRVGELDFRNATGGSSVFIGAYKLETIDKIILSEKTHISAWFNTVTTLKNITFEGVIAGNGLNLQWSPNLTYETLRSIINCLQDKSGDTSGTSWVVTVGSTNLAKLTADDLTEINLKGWYFK